MSSDLRLIIHRLDEQMLLCYMDHHDEAYRWAERRMLEVHPATGAAQMVVLPEVVKPEVVMAVPQGHMPAMPSIRMKSLLATISEEELEGFGIPNSWIPELRRAAHDEDALLGIVENLPAEAREAALALAVG